MVNHFFVYIWRAYDQTRELKLLERRFQAVNRFFGFGAKFKFLPILDKFLPILDKFSEKIVDISGHRLKFEKRAMLSHAHNVFLPSPENRFSLSFQTASQNDPPQKNNL